MRPGVPHAFNPQPYAAVLKPERNSKVHTGLTLSSLIKKRDPSTSLEPDWHTSSIPSRLQNSDCFLVASGFQVPILAVSNSATPVRELDRKSLERKLAVTKDEFYPSRTFNSPEQADFKKLKRSAKHSKSSVPCKLPRIKKRALITTDTEEAKTFVSIRPLGTLSTRKDTVITFEDAQRDKEWVMKAREQIMNDTFEKLARGNGVAVNEGGTFKFFIGKGNNSKLIKNIMQTRWWWTRTDNREDANLVWTQTRDMDWFQNAERAQDEWAGAPDDSEITCKIRFNADKAMKHISSQVDICSLSFDSLFTPGSFQAGVTNDWTGKPLRTHNKLEQTYHLANKKALYINLKKYCDVMSLPLFDRVPLTFHIKSGPDDPEFQNFIDAFEGIQEADKNSKNLWIVKPGENSNRGTGITVCNSISQVSQEVKPTICERTKAFHTYIVQRYLDRPYLINKRKFDLRLYALITSVNSCMQGYYYSEGYLRTSSKDFSLTNMNRMIHLTNDAVQKKCDDYGRFESGNKLSYRDLQRYLDANYGSPVSFENDVLPKVINLMRDTMLATFVKLDPRPKVHSFEVYGYDFMLDADLKPWLIEVNTNPCLELSAGTLARIIPQMLENAFQIALDPYFREPKAPHRRHSTLYKQMLRKNKFKLIFNSRTDGSYILERARETGMLAKLVEVELDLEELSKDDEEVHDDEAAPA